MEAFYSFSERFAKIRSKRIKKAVKGIGGGLSSEVIDHTTVQEGSRNKNKKRLARHETEDNTSDKDSNKGGDENEKSKSKRTRLEKPSSSRGRGRAQKRGRGRGRGKGRDQRDLLELSDGSSDDNDKVVDLEARHDASLQNVRRSTRSRNPVKYNTKEDDELDESRSNENLEDVEFLRDEDSSERNQNETTTIDASSPINFEMGGGFCADEEAEIGDARMDDRATDDYIAMGGGFCVDEDETGEDNAKTESEEHINKSKRRNEEGASLEENDVIEIENSSAGGLSAMPFLKRKKRRR